MRMTLEGGVVDWKYTFDDAEYMADITQKPGEDYIHGCGYDSSNSVIFRLETSRGDASWVKKVSTGDSEKCRGIIDWKDPSTGANLLVAIIESDGGVDFGGQSTGYKDAVLLVIDTSGEFLRAQQLSLKSAGMTISDGAFVVYGNSFYFGGSAQGYTTRFQTDAFADSMSNGFIFKYEFDHPRSHDCIYEWNSNTAKIRSVTSAVGSEFISKASQMAMELKNDCYMAYQSPYSGGFALKNSFVIPRPCANTAINMTDVNYYYGQRAYEFDLKVEPGVSSAFSKMQTPLFTHQNGTAVGNWLATMDLPNQKIYIQTKDQNLVNTHRTWIEGCSKTNDLLMVNLYVRVLDNSAPNFVGGLQTTYRMDPGNKRTGKIPYYEDK
jgi:hypothetical protein